MGNKIWCRFRFVTPDYTRCFYRMRTKETDLPLRFYFLSCDDRGRYLALSHFCFRIFSNHFSQKFEKIKITVWMNDNSYVWKFLFRFVLILLHIKSASKKIWHLGQGRILDPCLGLHLHLYKHWIKDFLPL